jgi:hypothetical protein
MDDESFANSLRTFLNEVGAAAADEIERAVRRGEVTGTALRLRVTIAAEEPPLQRVFETRLDLPPPATPESAAMF